MARAQPEAPSSQGAIPTNTLVVDPGSYTIKAGLVSWQDEETPAECRTIPNCIARARTKHTYIGSSLSKCNDFGEMQFKRPVERGFVVNWDLERAIFEHEFLEPAAELHCDPSATSLLLTEPSNAPSALSSNADQIVFEEFAFAAATRINGPSLNALNPLPPALSSSASTTATPLDLPLEILLLIDSSHSATTITPLLRGNPIPRATRRITLGGKHVTNYLAELISLRHFSLMDEPHIVSQIKEDACFVSLDFAADLERCWKGPRGDRREVDSGIVVDYVLPDFEKLHRGYVRPRRPRRRSGAGNGRKHRGGSDESEGDVHDRMRNGGDQNDPGPGQNGGEEAGEEEEEEVVGESFPLANERFVAPEILFNPLDIGQRESGICDTAMQSLGQVPRSLWQGLLGNVVCVGGNALLPGFVDRVQEGLRHLAPADVEVRVASAPDPLIATWTGGRALASKEEWLRNVLVTRDEYLEHGEGWVMRRFAKNRVVKEWPAESLDGS